MLGRTRKDAEGTQSTLLGRTWEGSWPHCLTTRTCSHEKWLRSAERKTRTYGAKKGGKLGPVAALSHSTRPDSSKRVTRICVPRICFKKNSVTIGSMCWPKKSFCKLRPMMSITKRNWVVAALLHGTDLLTCKKGYGAKKGGKLGPVDALPHSTRPYSSKRVTRICVPHICFKKNSVTIGSMCWPKNSFCKLRPNICRPLQAIKIYTDGFEVGFRIMPTCSP